MQTTHALLRRTGWLTLLISPQLVWCWTVKIVNLTDEKITIDIKSSQAYVGWDKGPVSRSCEFIGKQVDAHAWRDFNYQEVNPLCAAPCTKSITITSPVQLDAPSTLTSCSNVIVIVRKDASGSWKLEYNDWTDDIIKMLEERTRMPVGVRKLYDELGDSPIQTLSVFRQPIMAGIRELMKIITKNELRKLNYDELYHTGFIITCKDQIIRLERNETVISDVQIIKLSEKKKLDQREVSLPRAISYHEFISNAMEGDPDFWKYHPITNNCQAFVLQCLKKNDIPVPDELHKFIYQDAAKIVEKSPILREFSISVTSLANRIDKILEGGSTTQHEIDDLIKRGEIIESSRSEIVPQP